MSILIGIIQGLGGIVIGIINLYKWIIIVVALLSFVKPDPYNPIIQVLYRITNPAYILVKSYIRTDFNGLDLAPVAIIIALEVVIVILNSILRAL